MWGNGMWKHSGLFYVQKALGLIPSMAEAGMVEHDYNPIIPERRQKDQKFKTILGYRLKTGFMRPWPRNNNKFKNPNKWNLSFPNKNLK